MKIQGSGRNMPKREHGNRREVAAENRSRRCDREHESELRGKGRKKKGRKRSGGDGRQGSSVRLWICCYGKTGMRKRWMFPDGSRRGAGLWMQRAGRGAGGRRRRGLQGQRGREGVAGRQVHLAGQADKEHEEQVEHEFSTFLYILRKNIYVVNFFFPKLKCSGFYVFHVFHLFWKVM